MASPYPQFSPARVRSYIFRLPLCTRLITSLLWLFWLAGLQSRWDIVQWGALIPKQISLTSSEHLTSSMFPEVLAHARAGEVFVLTVAMTTSIVYRFNTFPLIHKNILSALLNTFALVPLLQRFEAGHGTLLTLSLFGGPLSTLPAGLYWFIERIVWRGNAPVTGASVWIFVLVAIEAAKAYQTNPYFSVGPYKIPTWSTPFILTLFVAFLVPNTSFVANLCGVTVGVLFGLGYLKILAPPERPLRWIEGKLDLLGKLPHYVSIDQNTYGRYGVLPSSSGSETGIPLSYRGSSQRLGV